MNRSDMRTKVLAFLNESSTNTGFDSTTLNTYLDTAWREIWTYKNIPWWWLRKETAIDTVYTAIGTYSSLTSFTVDSASNIYIGQRIYVIDDTETLFDEVQVKTIASTTVTLESPGLLSVHAADDYVISACSQLPSDFNSLVSVKCCKIDSDEMVESSPSATIEKDVDNLYGIIKSTGTPENYWIVGRNLYYYPLPDAVWRYYIKYIAKASDLGDATTPEIPAEFADAICYLAAAKALISDVRTGSQSTGQTAQTYMAIYQDYMNRMEMSQYYKPNNRVSWTRLDSSDLPSFS